MAPEDRKSYTDAVKCLMDQPSQLDPAVYPAAVNRYMDYAVTHVNRTQYVHLDAFFLTWHRYFLWLYESDLRQSCGYTGAFPYWDFASTASDPSSFPIFDGSDYSMSGDGLYNNTGNITLGPALSIPPGSGGGCVTTGPFANMIAPLAFIDPTQLTTGVLPEGAFDYNPICLMRDLNAYVSQTYTNGAQLLAAAHAANASDFEYLLNGVIGSSSLGIHSGAHFSVGGQMDSIHVSAQDPIWYPLHTMIDKVYTSWQINYPDMADQLDGSTGTALNTPPSAVVTLDSVLPDWGYFQLNPIQVSDLISTTAGPFCYQYDNVIS
jgi:tyrosinase